MRSIPRHPFVRSAAALVGGLLLGFAIVACGDSGESDPRPTATVLPATPTPTAQNGSALPLQRYHYVASFAIQSKGRRQASKVEITTEGNFESPDKHAFTHTVGFGALELGDKLVLIGNDAWLKRGDARWRKTARDGQGVRELLLAAFSPARAGFLGGERYDDLRDAVRRLASTEETVNGVASNHYQVSAEGAAFFEAFLADERLLANVEDLSWDIWLAQDGGWPVRVRASSTVTADLQINKTLEVPAPAVWELRIDISRPDDPRLAVRPPREGG